MGNTVTQLTQLEREPLDALVQISFEQVSMIGRAGHQPANKIDWINAVNLRIIVLMNVSGSGDQDDINAANALATYQLAFASIDALANP